MASEQQHFDAARQFQAFYDEALSKVGGRAPAPVLGQSVDDYRRETLRQLKRTFLPPAHDLYQVQYRSLRSDALGAIEPQLLQACVTEAVNPAHVAPGEFKEIVTVDPRTGYKEHRFIGPESFVKGMTIPGRRARFLVPRVDGSGRALREFVMR